MRSKSISILLSSLFVALASSAVLAGAAQAGPAWYFNEEALTGKETVVGHAVTGSFVIPGLTTTCKPFVLKMTIFNNAGTGAGEITQVPLSNCFTNTKACTVESIQANKLPWPVSLATVSKVNHYPTIKGVEFDIVYEGEECVLGGVLVTLKGSAGGLIDNPTESVTFNAATFAATGTSLGPSVEWNSTFTLLATGSRIGQSLSVK